MNSVFATPPILVQLPLAATEIASEGVYEFARLESFGDSPWVVPALIGGLALLLAYVWLVYRREARTVSSAKATVLALLRTTAIVGLVAFFLGIERRSSTLVVEPSRVAVLVDTSLSMDLPANDRSLSNDTTSRVAAVRMLLAASPLVDELRDTHDVELVAFGDTLRPTAYLPTTGDADEVNDTPAQADSVASVPLTADRLETDFAAVDHETRIGDAIAATLERYQGLPLAGIVLLTDGGQNRGLDLTTAGEAAGEARVRVHSVGYGPTTAPANVALRELIAPERAYPGDKLTLQAIVHIQDLAGRQVELQLARRPAGDGADANATEPWELLETRSVSISHPDSLETVRFETSPDEAGNYIYEVRALPSPREVIKDDNAQQAEVAIIDRQTRVLLYAGGPTRDYRFVRNQLRRDDSFVVDVLLASGAPGISQDANEILSGFPVTAEQLSQYDAVVAFDPDWTELSAEQVRWLEQWVARQAGGLIVIPGRVNTPQWGISSRMRTIRGLYPVRMPDQLLDLRTDEQGRDVARKLRFTREGAEAEFLWLADNRNDSDEAWEQFDGVYSALVHSSPKPGATVYAHLMAASDDERGPAYLVGHYYGAGQVMYVGSGELWRLRKLDAKYYDRLWTSLLRHSSQARLLQGSPRGKLLVSQDRYEVGATVPVRAVMLDQQMEPLVAESLPLDLTMPGGGSDRLLLAADPGRAGNFAGEFRVVVPGAYRMTLAVPESTDELERTIRVATPQLEVTQTTRDATGLAALAKATDGVYYESPSIALSGSEAVPSIVAATPSQSRTKRVIGAIDKAFARQQSLVLLALVVGALCLEWIVRRLNYLA